MSEFVNLDVRVTLECAPKSDQPSHRGLLWRQAFDDPGRRPIGIDLGAARLQLSRKGIGVHIWALERVYSPKTLGALQRGRLDHPHSFMDEWVFEYIGQA